MIDWDKPYGRMCGPPPVPGGIYTQGDKYFRVDGSEVVVVEIPEPIVVEGPNPFPVEEDPLEIPAEDLKDKIVLLLNEGLTHTEIGIKLGITRQKVTRIANFPPE